MGARERFQRDQRIAHKEDPRALNGASSNGHRNGQASGSSMPQESAQYEKAAQGMNDTHGTNNHSYLPTHHTPTKKTRGIQADGESGRRGVHPFKALKLILRSVSTLSAVTNILWPFVPAAIILHFLGGDHHTWTFATAYIGMVPAAALLGFAGQEFARKLPTVAGTVIESLFGSIVEIILFMVLVRFSSRKPGHFLLTVPTDRKAQPKCSAWRRQLGRCTSSCDPGVYTGKSPALPRMRIHCRGYPS